MKKRFLCLIMGLVLTFDVALASGYTVQSARCYKPSGYGFSSSWQKTWDVYYSNAYTGTIQYGYDTFLVNEDYTKGVAEDYTHYSVVVNDNGLSQSPDKAKTVWSKVDKVHSGSSSQVYSIYYKSFPFNVTHYDFDLE